MLMCELQVQEWQHSMGTLDVVFDYPGYEVRLGALMAGTESSGVELDGLEGR